MSKNGGKTSGADEWYADGLRFACTQCGNCCSGPAGYVWFDGDELLRMAEYVQMSPERFLRSFAHSVNGNWTLNERVAPNGRDRDCVFLRRDSQTGKAMCGIYQVRPMQCRTWPFWPDNLRSPRNWERAAERCPGMKAGGTGDTAKGTYYPIEKIRIQRDATPQ